MATITLRAVKGSPLTIAEVDNNFSNLKVGADLAEAATNANTASTIVKRDASGNFSAGTITANLTGNASTATTLQTARTISLTGDVTGSVSFNGSADVSINAVIAANSIVLGTDTTGNYVATIAGTANQVNVSGSGTETAAITLSLPQDIASTSSPTFANVTSTNLPTNNSHLVNRDFAYRSIWKDAVRAVASTNISLSSPGASIDSVSMVAGDRFLAAGQTTASQNGIYVWNGSAVAATRAPDADASVRLSGGSRVQVLEGSVYTDTQWVLTTNNPITLGTTSLTFTESLSQETRGIAQLANVNGYIVRNGFGTFIARTMAVAGTGLSITNADGVAGNTTITSNATNANTPSTVVARDASGNFAAGTITAALTGNASSATLSNITDDTTTNATRYLTFVAGTSGNQANTVSSTKLTYNPSTGTLVSTAFSGNGSALTNLTAGNLTGTIPSAVLGNSALFIGTTSIALNRASAAQTLTGTSIDGNAGTATTLQTARTISLTGDVTGSVSFNGSANVSIAATIAPDSVALGTDTTGNYVATIAGTANQVNVSGSGSETASVTLSLPQDIASTSSPTFANVTSSNIPTTDTHLVNRDFLYRSIWKDPVRVVANTNVNLASPGTSIDGVTLSAGDRFLAAGQTTASQNGIYVWNGSAVAATRSVDANTSAKVPGGIRVQVLEGTAFADTQWVLTTNNPITLGTTSLTFTESLSQETRGIAQLANVNGFISRTGSGTFAARSFTVSGTGLSITNGDGVAGSPTITSNATNANTPSTVVARDASGNFAAGTITANTSGTHTGAVVGNADTASKWQTARTITLGGDLTGNVSIDGSANVTLNATIAADSVALGTDTTGNYVASVTVSGVGLSATGTGEGAAVTITSNATSANTVSTVVARDASGNFSAGTITATLSGNASTATNATNATNTAITDDTTTNATRYLTFVAGTSGNQANTVSSTKLTYNPSTGALSSTSFIGALTGNASTATTLQTARTINGVSFNGSSNITVTANTTNALTIGSFLTGGSFNGSSAVTIAVDATSANTASKVVARDASGNFSAGTITANLTGNASTATTLQTARTINGTSFDGSANITTAIWGTSRTISLTGDVTGSASVDGSANASIAVTVATASETVAGKVELATAAEVAAGSGSQVVTSGTLRSDGRMQRFYESAQQTITSGGQLTLAHGLGAKPLLVTARLINTTAELGYSVGDEIEINLVNNSQSGTTRFNSVILTATNIVIRFSGATDVFASARPDTGAIANLTNANWRLVVRAWE